MTKSNTAPSVMAYADQAMARSRILNNKYFDGLIDGSMSIESFRASQCQFFYAVEYFPRPMAALIARIPSAKTRLDLIHNLVEEHGHFNEQAFHCTTFNKFLQSIADANDGGLQNEEQPQHPAIRAFNGALNNACSAEELETGIACMGVIEHSFAVISAMIGEAVVNRGWVKSSSLIHYQLHAQIDERHAEEFFAILEPHWGNPARRYYIEQGIELGLHIFDRLYRELLEIGQNAQQKTIESQCTIFSYLPG